MKQEDQIEPEVSQYEYRLQEEIHFWQNMISNSRKNDRNADLTRMLEAKALAEYRLLQFSEAKENTKRH